jgi:hypothetical protein
MPLRIAGKPDRGDDGVRRSQIPLSWQGLWLLVAPNFFGPAAVTAAASCGYNSWGLRTANPRRSQSLFAS